MADEPDLRRLTDPSPEDLSRLTAAMPTRDAGREDEEIAALRQLLDDFFGPADVLPGSTSVRALWRFAPRTGPRELGRFLATVIEQARAGGPPPRLQQIAAAVHVTRPSARHPQPPQEHDDMAQPEHEDGTVTLRFSPRTWERLETLADREDVDVGVALGQIIDRQWFLETQVDEGARLLLRRGRRMYALSHPRRRLLGRRAPETTAP